MTKSNKYNIRGVDDAVFYTAVYMTVATILQILVCFLAARDTYKRVKLKEKSQHNSKKLPGLSRKKTNNIDSVTRTMNEVCSPIQSTSKQPIQSNDETSHDISSDQSINEPSPLILQPKTHSPLSNIKINSTSPTISPLSIASPDTPLELMEANNIDKLPRLNSPLAIFCFFSVGM
eukprot:872999_1